ncbi:MAG: 50S ribosomal protein L29 [Victivallaceae bacterium]|nr:50S ribosomal protein L29 [Victivallaceae bacterium]
MENKAIKELTDVELAAKIAELRREKLNLKIQSRTGQLEKTAHVREVRRDIARCLTETTARAAKAEVAK